jgi:biopolymer transport protein TolQ
MAASSIPAAAEQASQVVSAAVNKAPALASHSMSLWGLFWGAEPVIKLVMIGLIVASIWSWAIIIHKTMKLRKLNTEADSFEEAFWSGGALDDLYERLQSKVLDPISAIFVSAMREWRRSVSKGAIRSSERGTIEQRIDRVMQVTITREMESLERNTGFLASLGSNGVIVGLFGTVIGIMNTFEPIAMQQNTSLAAVAPSIAEALFATAIGLIAAIPAAIAYNKISSDINRFANRLDSFANEFSSIISHQLEETNHYWLAALFKNLREVAANVARFAPEVRLTSRLLWM